MLHFINDLFTFTCLLENFAVVEWSIALQTNIMKYGEYATSHQTFWV